MKVLGNLQFSDTSQFKNLIIENLEAAPTLSATQVGRIFFNTTDSKLYVNDGNAWSTIGSGGASGDYVPNSAVGAAGGVAPLNASSLIDQTYLPKVASASSADYATSAGQLTIGRTLTIGNTGKIFNGSSNISWSLAEI
jgi:hypothetical protein